jgi:hypothetical protein
MNECIGKIIYFIFPSLILILSLNLISYVIFFLTWIKYDKIYYKKFKIYVPK